MDVSKELGACQAFGAPSCNCYGAFLRRPPASSMRRLVAIASLQKGGRQQSMVVPPVPQNYYHTTCSGRVIWQPSSGRPATKYSLLFLDSLPLLEDLCRPPSFARGPRHDPKPRNILQHPICLQTNELSGMSARECATSLPERGIGLSCTLRQLGEGGVKTELNTLYCTCMRMGRYARRDSAAQANISCA